MVTFMPNIDGNKYNDDSLISGELIKKVKVMPNGILAVIKPINKGMDEQEQNGVTMPSNAAIK